MLTPEQISAVKLILDGDQGDETNPRVLGLNDYVNKIVEAREDMFAVGRVHQGFADNAELVTVLKDARNRAKAAADALSILLA